MNTLAYFAAVLSFSLIVFAYGSFLLGRTLQVISLYAVALVLLTPYLMIEHEKRRRIRALDWKEIARRAYSSVRKRVRTMLLVYLTSMLGLLAWQVSKVSQSPLARFYFVSNSIGWILIGIGFCVLVTLAIRSLRPLRTTFTSGVASVGFVLYFFSGAQIGLSILVLSGLLSLVTAFRGRERETRVLGRSVFAWTRELAVLSTLIISVGLATSPVFPRPFYGGALFDYMDNYLAGDQLVANAYFLTMDEVHYTVMIKLNVTAGTRVSPMKMIENAAGNVTRLSQDARPLFQKCLQIVDDSKDYTGTQLDLLAETRIAYLDFLGNFSLFTVAYGQAYTHGNASTLTDLRLHRKFAISSLDAIETIVSKGSMLRFAPAFWNFDENKVNEAQLMDDMYAEVSRRFE